MTKKKGSGLAPAIGGILVGFDQQVFRTQPPANELVAKGAPLPSAAAAGGGRLTVGMPNDTDAADRLELSADGVEAVVDLTAGGRVASLIVAGRELLKTTGDGPIAWGSFPMAPYAGRVRDGVLRFDGVEHALPRRLPPHAIHGTVLDRRWTVLGEGTIGTELGPEWPFRGRAVQRFELAPDHLTCRLELHADEPMPASIGWHPYFARHLEGPGAPLELDLDAGAMLLRDASGIATDQAVEPGPGPWDDCFIELRRAPVLRWPGFLELTVESDCPAWVIYTAPEDAICVEPQTAAPNAVNDHPTIVAPGEPLVAEMTRRWRTLERPM
ncbi:MAG: aldose 1-epimerase [Chloroflexota bacterium]